MDSYDKAWYVGTVSKESGVIQGEVIAKEWDKNKEKWDKNGDGKIQYVMLKGEPGYPDAEARSEYSIKTLNEKGIETEELVIDTAMWDAAKATEKMDAWLAKFGDKIEFVICNNDGMASGAVASLEKEEYFSGDKFKSKTRNSSCINGGKWSWKINSDEMFIWNSPKKFR